MGGSGSTRKPLVRSQRLSQRGAALLLPLAGTWEEDWTNQLATSA